LEGRVLAAVALERGAGLVGARSYWPVVRVRLRAFSVSAGLVTRRPFSTAALRERCAAD